MATRSLGTLTLDLIARIGGFEAGLSKAERLSDKEFKKIQQNAEKAGKAIGTALAVGVAGLTAYVVHQADVISGFQDLAEKMGDTAENIASLQRAADVSETSFDAITAASIKMTAALSKTDDEGKGVGAALKYIGLELEAFKALSPVEQLDAVAQGLAGVENGADKTAVAVALFGKSGAELLPFLGDLADGSERQIRLTQEQIEQADEYQKAIARQKSEIAQLGQQYAADLIPVLADTLKVVIDLTKNTDDLTASGKKLADGNEVQEWAESAVIGIGTVLEAVVGLAKALRAIGGSFEAVFADAEYAGEWIARGGVFARIAGQGDALDAALEKRNRIVEDANKRYVDLWNYNGTALTDALRKQFGHVADVEQITNDLIGAVTQFEEFQVVQDQVPIPMRRGYTAPAKPGFSLAAPEKTGGASAKKPKAEVDAFTVSLKEYMQVLEDADQAQIDAVQSMREQAEQLAESLRTPNEIWEEQTRIIDELYNRGYIDAETRTRALSKANAELYEGLDALEPELVEVADQMSVFAEQAARNIQDSFADFLVDPFNDGLDSMLDGFVKFLKQAAAEALAAQLFDLIGGWGKANSGAGGIMGFVAGLAGAFGGGKAGGGAVSAGHFYEVNELRPELLTVGNRDYLMMGSQDGHVTATPKLATQSGLKVEQNFYVTGQQTDASRRSLKQSGLEASRMLQTAVRSNG